MNTRTPHPLKAFDKLRNDVTDKKDDSLIIQELQNKIDMIENYVKMYLDSDSQIDPKDLLFIIRNYK